MFMSSEADPTCDLPDFEVMGGCGEYFIIMRSEAGERRFQDLSRGDEDVEIWVSDQGTVIPASHLCPDLDLVIAAAKEFHDSGNALSAFPWVPKSD
jgi:hypothetical protein